MLSWFDQTKIQNKEGAKEYAELVRAVKEAFPWFLDNYLNWVDSEAIRVSKAPRRSLERLLKVLTEVS